LTRLAKATNGELFEREVIRENVSTTTTAYTALAGDGNTASPTKSVQAQLVFEGIHVMCHKKNIIRLLTVVKRLLTAPSRFCFICTRVAECVVRLNVNCASTTFANLFNIGALDVMIEFNHFFIVNVHVPVSEVVVVVSTHSFSSYDKDFF
jgi:hypothetical protein